METRRLARALPGAGQTKPNPDEARGTRKSEEGLVGLVNIGNSCYMNSALQALSNCPPFRQYLVECHYTSSEAGSLSSQGASDCLSALLKKMWTSEHPPGHLSPRQLSSSMKNKIFRGSLQQDAQEFLRCLLTQIHEEIGLRAPPPYTEEVALGEGPSRCHRDSTVSRDSDVSSTSGDSNTKLVVGGVSSSLGRHSPLVKKKSPQGLSLKKSGSHSSQGSPANQPKFSLRSSYSKVLAGSSGRGSVESVRGGRGSAESVRGSTSQQSFELHSFEPPATAEPAGLKWAPGDVFIADLTTRTACLHRHGPQAETASLVGGEAVEDVRGGGEAKVSGGCGEGEETSGATDVSDTSVPCVGVKEEGVKGEGVDGDCRQIDAAKECGRGTPYQTPSSAPHSIRSIVSDVFEGTLESRVRCSNCKKVSVTREPFQDLSLPIPGRKEMAKYSRKAGPGKVGGGGGGGGLEENVEQEGEEEVVERKSVFSRGFCTVLNFMATLTKDILVGPPTDIKDCLNAFFDVSDLKGDNQYYCEHCKSFKDSQKETSVICLPEVLCIHLKRFRFDAYFSTKISRHIAFPLTNLDLSGYMKDAKTSSGSLYDLNAVITHYGGAGGGHYVSFAKNSSRGTWFEFNDTRVQSVSADMVLGAEGYVLFYRKVAPSDSHPVRLMETTQLLPRTGTDLPSSDVCYISRHWLLLLKHCADPGPIFQHQFACRHGAVHPCRMRDVRSVAMPIRREIWDSLQQRYGGGPLVSRTDQKCSICDAHLKDLLERRKREKEDIHKLQSEEHSRGDKKPFLISAEWVQQWKNFIDCKNLDVGPPGAIDNTALLKVDGKDIIVVNAKSHPLSLATWRYFVGVYGGGPVLATSLEAAKAEC